jgi:hypothetical protein
VSLFLPIDAIADISERDVALNLVITPDAAFRPNAKTRDVPVGSTALAS